MAGKSSFFQVLNTNLGSSYVNNIVLLGQVNKVIVQAEEQYRKSFDDIKNLYIKTINNNFVQVKNFADLSENPSFSEMELRSALDYYGLNLNNND